MTLSKFEPTMKAESGATAPITDLTDGLKDASDDQDSVNPINGEPARDWMATPLSNAESSNINFPGPDGIIHCEHDAT
jgi:hypothetical protein